MTMVERIKKAAKGGTSKKDDAIAKEKGVLGVCLVARDVDGTGSYSPLSSGSVVRGLIELQGCQNKVFLITSDNIVSKKELSKLQRESDRKAFHSLKGVYRLYFKQRSDKQTTKGSRNFLECNLSEITNANDEVTFVPGVAIIPIDSDALSKRSGILDYRPFGINKEETKSSGGLICQIVDGTTDTIAVTPFHVEFVQRNEKCHLKLPVGDRSFSTLTQLKEYSSSLRPHGAVILEKNSEAVNSFQAVGVLTFVDDTQDDRVFLFWFSQLQVFGFCNSSKRSLAKEPEESKNDGSSKVPSEFLPRSMAGNSCKCTSSDNAVPREEAPVVTGMKSCTKLGDSGKTGEDMIRTGGHLMDQKVLHRFRDSSMDGGKHEEKHKVNKNTSLAEGLTRLKQKASYRGFTIVDNDRSGNCMFYALADQLKLVKGLNLSHLKVRQSIVQCLRNNPQGADLCPFVSDQYRSWDNYLTKMEQDSTWGDHMMLQAAADYYEVTIYVISSASREHNRTISPKRDSGSKHLVLGHVPELHYVSLRPTPDSFKLPDDSKSSQVDDGETVKQESISAERAAEDCISLPVLTDSLDQDSFKPPDDSKSSQVDDGETVKQESISAERAAEDCISLPVLTDSLDQVSALRSAPSSPDEKTRASMLKNLLKLGGTAALRGVFDKKYPPENLKEDLFANVSCLGSLLHQHILSNRQWDKLFPPDGSDPDSKSFDLILLFILLTNISGEPPPPRTWRKNPPQRRHLLMAYLARFRILHNQLCATGLCIDKRKFSALWHEISTILLDLGLDQSEIDPLKKPCREEHYPDVLIGWVYRKHQDQPDKDDFCRKKEKPPPTMEQSVQEILQVVTSTQNMIRGSIIKRKRDNSSCTEELQRESFSVKTEHVQEGDNQILPEAVSTETRERLDALSELSENDDENLDEFDDGDGGGSLHHLYMLIISIALSSVLTYLFCMFS